MTSRLTLSAAARLWGKSRQTLYTDAKAGRLSFGHDDQGRPFIDAAEMRRVYGEPLSRPDGAGDDAGHPADEASALVSRDREIKRLEDTVAILREQLAQAHKDKAEQAETHRAVLQLIEHQRPAPVAGRFAGLRGLFRRGGAA
jgi:hypothetical protein